MAYAIEMATELFFNGTSVRVVNYKWTEEKKLEMRVKSLKGKLDKVLQALEKSCSKRQATKKDGKRDSNGQIICRSCGEEGHLKRFCKNKKKAESSKANLDKDKVLEN